MFGFAQPVVEDDDPSRVEECVCTRGCACTGTRRCFGSTTSPRPTSTMLRPGLLSRPFSPPGLDLRTPRRRERLQLRELGSRRSTCRVASVIVSVPARYDCTGSHQRSAADAVGLLLNRSDLSREIGARRLPQKLRVDRGDALVLWLPTIASSPSDLPPRALFQPV